MVLRHFGPMPPGDPGTVGHTVPWMQKLIQEGKQDPAVRQFAERFRRSSDPVTSAFQWVQSLPYKLDPEEYEMLQGAPYLLSRGLAGVGFSDCDCRVILLNSLLESMGYETRIVLAKKPGRDKWHHVYSEVKVKDNWVALDTIFDNFTPGMSVPGPKLRVGESHGLFWLALAIGLALYAARKP